MDDAWYRVFTDAEDRELDGRDALIHSLVLSGVESHIPLVESVGRAKHVHEFRTEKLRFEAVLNGEQLGTSVLVSQPDMVSKAQLVHDVECWEHRGSEVIELLRSSPMVSIRKQGEDNSKRIVALLFEKLKPEFNEMNTFSYLYDMPMEKEYFKNLLLSGKTPKSIKSLPDVP